jgi:hypothetical protein
MSSEGSFVRWQAITIAQLGFTSNLILTLAVAALGFALTLVKDSDVIASCCGGPGKAADDDFGAGPGKQREGS